MSILVGASSFWVSAAKDEETEQTHVCSCSEKNMLAVSGKLLQVCSVPRFERIIVPICLLRDSSSVWKSRIEHNTLQPQFCSRYGLVRPRPLSILTITLLPSTYVASGKIMSMSSIRYLTNSSSSMPPFSFIPIVTGKHCGAKSPNWPQTVLRYFNSSIWICFRSQVLAVVQSCKWGGRASPKCTANTDHGCSGARFACNPPEIRESRVIEAYNRATSFFP